MGSRTGHQTDEGSWDGWTDYMHEKKRKLSDQFLECNPGSSKGTLFKGVSIYVNGYTEPSSDVLRRLIIEYGGSYHSYYSLSATSHIVALNLPHNKIEKLRASDKVVHPSWITQSISEGRLLNDIDFLVYKPGQNNASSLEKFVKRDILKTTDPKFLAEFYGRSRLHHISIWSQQLKTLVANLREKHDGNFSGHQKILQAMESVEDERGGNAEGGKVIMHIDMDCFFVSVGLLKHDHLRGQPVAVTHSNSKPSNGHFNSRAEIASCSYEARAFGVKSGSYFGEALKLCPTLKSISYDFQAYHTVSQALYSILASYTMDLEAISCDELYVDMTQLCSLFNLDPFVITAIIRQQIKEETGCPVSAGLGPNMLLARLATKRAKPDGQFRILSNEVANYMAVQKVGDLPGVGYRTEQRLSELGITTCDQLARYPSSKLISEFSAKTANNLQSAAIGQDSRCMTYDSVRKSVSCDVNYAIRMKETSELDKFLCDLAEEVVKRLIECSMKAKTITLKLLIRAEGAPVEPSKYMGHGLCDTFSKSTSITNSTQNASIIAQEAISLAKCIKPTVTDIRGIGISVHKLEWINERSKSSPRKQGRSLPITSFMQSIPLCDSINPVNNKIGHRNSPSPKPSTSKLTDAHQSLKIDQQVFNELPQELQLELRNAIGLPTDSNVSPVPQSIDRDVWINLPASIKREIRLTLPTEATTQSSITISPGKTPKKEANFPRKRRLKLDQTSPLKDKSPRKLDAERRNALTLSMIWNPNCEYDSNNEDTTDEENPMEEAVNNGVDKVETLSYNQLKSIAKQLVQTEIENDKDAGWIEFTAHVQNAIRGRDLETATYILRLLHNNENVRRSLKWKVIFNSFKANVLFWVQDVFGFELARCKVPLDFDVPEPEEKSR